MKPPAGQASTTRPTAAGIVLAAGSGTRFGGSVNKAYLPLAGQSLISWSLNIMATIRDISPLVLVIRPEDHRRAEEVLDKEVAADVEIVYGDATRQGSELRAFRHLVPRIDAGLVDSILIHDSARPLLSEELCAAVLHATREYGAAIPALYGPDLSVTGDDGATSVELHRDHLVRAQTPQGFAARPLVDAYEAAARDGLDATDTAGCVARYTDLSIRWISGEDQNFKITYAHDLVVAQKLLAALDHQVH
jgi:2-C-methyl-D-erythritol 4-phosphate cytidylyltransferase